MRMLILGSGELIQQAFLWDLEKCWRLQFPAGDRLKQDAKTPVFL